MKEAVEKLKSVWAQAVLDSDIKSLISLYSEKALLKPTLSQKIRQGHQEITPYFTGPSESGGLGFLHQGIVKIDFTTSYQIQIENCYVEMGHYTFTKEEGDEIKADYTFVLTLDENAQTLIQSHHSSLSYQ
jgi:hypothetical protein